MKFSLLVLNILFAVSSILSAQNLTLEDIYQKGVIRTEGAGAFHWMDDGESYTRIEFDRTTRGQSIVQYNVKGNKRNVLVSAKMLIPKGATKPISIRSYSWSADKSKLLIFNNTRKVWRYHTRGDYWVLNRETGALSQLGKSLPEAMLMFAKFSPDAEKVAYVCQQNIYVEELKTNTIEQLTSDGGNTIINGTFDWVYEEEFGCRDGFRWSEDGKHIAFWQSNTEGTGTFYMINNLDSNYSQPIPLPYPKAGTANSAVKIGIVKLSDKHITWLNIPGDPRNNYLPRMELIPSANKLIIQQMNRMQNTNKVYFADIKAGKTTHIFTEEAEAWLETNNDIKWLDNGKYFTWMSDKSGFMHLYKISVDGKQMIPLTSGNFEVESVLNIDEKTEQVLYTSVTDKFTERALFRIKMDGSSKAVQLTPNDLKGHSTYNISPNGKWAVHSFSNVENPAVVSMVKLPSHKTQRVIVDNAKAKEDYDALNLNAKEFIQLDVGDVVLDAWMIKPANFDPNKKYPVIFQVYGEPAGSTVQNKWEGGDLWHQYLAQQGYVVMSVDNRGADVPRGREWRKCIYGEVGVLASQDQANAALKVCELYPFVDRERIGIWGWSGGGSMTLNSMFRYPNIYKTGIAVAFVADQKLYDTIYQERYMGTPQSNPQGYFNGSPINFTEGLKGNLLLIHGSGDDNVHYQNCEQLMDKLIKHNKMFYAVPYPMRSHSIYERENTSLHLRKTMEKFWNQNL